MKYRKIPVVIEAIQWKGDNLEEIYKLEDSRQITHVKTWDSSLNDSLVIHTLEGDMRVKLMDYIIKGVQGELYPCKPDIFEQTYEKV